jgi:nucleoid DNA-binding protein
MAIPDDPAKFIKGMEEYSIGMRIDLENTSVDAIQALLAFPRLMAGMQGGEKAMQMFDQADQSFELLCKEFRTMIAGFTMDPKTADVDLRVHYVVKPGSASEKAIAFQKNAKTVFGGFLGDANAVATFSTVGVGLKDMPEQLKLQEAQLDQLIEGLLEQVEDNAEEDEDVELAQAVADSAKKILLGISALDKGDFGLSLGNDGTLALGISLAERGELEKIGSLLLKRLEKLASADQKAVDALKKIKTNYATVEGFQLSSFVFPFKEIAETNEDFPAFLAEKTFYLYWGLKDDALVLIAGFDPKSEDLLKTAIAAMKNPVAASAVKAKFSLMQFGKLMTNFQIDKLADDPQTAVVVKAFLDAGSDANITLSTQTGAADTMAGTITISGKIWEAIAKIVAAGSSN